MRANQGINVGWLNYSDDEVSCFHPAFKAIADEALVRLALSEKYLWEHHPRRAGVQTIPDYVLVEKNTNRWILIVEIKRSRSSVYSERSQVQAKGYAEANQNSFYKARPKYFAVTNLESTLLFAINGINSARQCRVEGMTFESGSFIAAAEKDHKIKLIDDLSQLITFVISGASPTFDFVWLKIAQDFISQASSLEYNPVIDLGASSLPKLVSDYFTGIDGEVAKRQLLLRCLLAEYLKGILVKYQHRRSSGLPLLRPGVMRAASIIDALISIDFSGVFEATSPNIYRDLVKFPQLRAGVETYISTLIEERVDKLAERNDALIFPEILIAEAYPRDTKSAQGKAQTDPELAALLSALTVTSVDSVIFDPGCGDGSLLSAAYDSLRDKGANHGQALSKLKGLDADSVAAKIAALRLALKEPYAVDISDPNHISPGDMFSSVTSFSDVEVVLMNPPFKRYESQDASPVPPPLRKHFCDKIGEIEGSVETNIGQANLYNLYVEFVIKASKKSTILGIILDNRWYHNKSSSKLREILLRECEILAVVSYPHDLYFDGWAIATSIVVLRKRVSTKNHLVHFLRTNDPRAVDFNSVADALHGTGKYPNNWSVNKVDQSALTGESWQSFFSTEIQQDFRSSLSGLDDMFEYSRRGSLAKEGGGIAVYEFPFSRKDYGPQRFAKPLPRSNFQTGKGRDLTSAENLMIRESAESLDQEFRGYAIQNADQPNSYVLQINDVTRDQTLETPIQRTPSAMDGYRGERRRGWDAFLDSAVDEIKNNKSSQSYTNLIEKHVGLKPDVLTKPEIWNVLREPYAGELIIPRKVRVGHRVHINPFAYELTGRQVRLSSNFFSYSNCIALDETSGLDRRVSVELITAFLLSSFGQVQFEMEAYNREGARSIEQHQLRKIKVLDPRKIRLDKRALILSAAAELPYPAPTDCDPRTQPKLILLDKLFAAELAYNNSNLDEDLMLDEVWQLLSEWLEARRP